MPERAALSDAMAAAAIVAAGASPMSDANPELGSAPLGDPPRRRAPDDASAALHTGRGTEHAPAGRSAAPSLLLPLAAIAIAGLVLAIWLPQLRGSSLSVVALISSLPAPDVLGTKLEERWYDNADLPRWRGAEPSHATTPLTAFRLGMHAVDVEVARRQRDRTAARFVAAQIARLCGSDLELLHCQEYFERVAEDPEPLWEPGHGPPSALLEVEPLLATQLGRWAEASRLAAMVRDAEFFRSPGWRRGLELLEHPAIDARLADFARRLRDDSGDDQAARARAVTELIRRITDESLSLARDAE